ncbi:MAG: TauD/TfdA family dioxygenase [Verrucomicrobia bacterium]|nr:TauD/TfdA family dioxygenase [Verrucomicrobiota bacterium]
MGLRITKLNDLFAAEVEGIDLARPIDDDVFDQLESAFYEHSVLIFRDQNLTEQQHIEFSKKFGPLEPTMVNDPSGGGGWINRISNVDTKGNIIPPSDKSMLYLKGNLLWHSDSSYKKVPSRGALLYALEIPSQGGETEYASMKAGYSALPEEKKKLFQDLVAEHSLLYSRNKISPGLMDTDFQNEVPPVPQKLIRDIPETGEKTLFLGAHASHILGWSIEEGRALLNELLEWTTQSRFVYRHSWKPGDLVMWDNRCSLHRGRPWDAENARRVLRRTTLLGDGPTV